MVHENKEKGARDPIKILLKEALEKKMNAMMDNFSWILQQLPTSGASASNIHSRGTTPFKVQVNFDIPIFHVQIHANAIDRWLNLLEGYSSIHDFSNQKKIIFSLLKATPHVKD